MALKWLTVEEMIQISDPLVTEGNEARSEIDGIAVLAALLPSLRSAHAAIFAVRLQPADPKLRELVNRENALDAEHDDRVRGIHGALTGLALVSDDPTELVHLRDTLFPEGLRHTKKSYRGQAGHAAMVEARLDDQTKSRLKAVNLHHKNLLELTQGWLALAKQLGAAEDERAKLEPQPSSAADMNNARLGWIRIMNVLIANAELANLDAATDRLLFGPLRAAEQAATNRGRGKTAATPEVPAASTTPAATAATP